MMSIDRQYIEHKKDVVRSGNCSLLKEWQNHFKITVDQMIEMVEWIEEDPEKNYAALTADGWKPLTKRTERTLTVFRDLEGNAWDGETFRMPVPEKQQEIYGKTMDRTQKVAISYGDLRFITRDFDEDASEVKEVRL